MKQLLQEAYAALCNSDTDPYSLKGIREFELRDKLRAAIDAPEQKPVAWFELNESLDAWFLSYSFNPKGKTRPLYAKPQPVAELTDDEIDGVRDSQSCPAGVLCLSATDVSWFARAVLAAQRGKA